MCFKGDICKDFDIVSWDFILLALQKVGILDQMGKWIETCMTTSHILVPTMLWIPKQ